MLTHLVKLQLGIDAHSEHGSFLVTQLGHYPVVLGVKWLQIHDPFVSWSRNTLTFSSSYCAAECLPGKRSPLVVPGIPDPLEEFLVKETASSSNNIASNSSDPSEESLSRKTASSLNHTVPESDSQSDGRQTPREDKVPLEVIEPFELARVDMPV